MESTPACAKPGVSRLDLLGYQVRSPLSKLSAKWCEVLVIHANLFLDARLPLWKHLDPARFGRLIAVPKIWLLEIEIDGFMGLAPT